MADSTSQSLAARAANRADAIPLIVGYVVALGLFLWWGGFRGYDRSPELVLGTFGGTVANATAAQIAGYSRRSSRPMLVAVLVGAPLVLFAWKVGFSELFDGASRWWPSKPGLRCLRLSTADGAAMLAGALAARRGTVTAQAPLTGAAMGAASGAGAWVLVDLWCPVGHPLHVLLGHVVPTFVLAALGAWPGSLILRARSATPGGAA